MSQTEHVLLVEDDSGLRELLQEELESEGYRVTACGDAEKGLAVLGQEPVDLLVSDLR
ncbi:MAG: response regulator, partial [Pseudomonas sp.]|nr:response regulator [Pseudomonas sp.]MBQ0778021.1 response regulator [Pseudomonas sp.]